MNSSFVFELGQKVAEKQEDITGLKEQVLEALVEKSNAQEVYSTVLLELGQKEVEKELEDMIKEQIQGADPQQIPDPNTSAAVSAVLATEI